LWETEFSIPPEQAEKRSGCLKPGNGFCLLDGPLKHFRCVINGASFMF